MLYYSYSYHSLSISITQTLLHFLLHYSILFKPVLPIQSRQPLGLSPLFEQNTLEHLHLHQHRRQESMSTTTDDDDDLRVSSLAIHNLNQTLSHFQSHAMSVLTLSHQWRNFHNAFSRAHTSFQSRFRNLEAKESQFHALKIHLDNSLLELQTNKNNLALDQNFFNERLKEFDERTQMLSAETEFLKWREDNLKQQLQLLDSREEQFSEQSQHLQAQQIRLKEDRLLLESKEKEFDVLSQGFKLKELKFSESFQELLAREKQLSEQSQELQLSEQRRALELKEEEYNALCDSLKLKEDEINSKGSEIDSRVLTLDEDRKQLDVKQNELDELYTLLELREQELNDRTKLLELKEADAEIKCEALELKEKEVDSKYQGLDAKEKIIQEGLAMLELKESQINTLKNNIEIRERALREKCQELEAKKKDWRNFKLKKKDMKKRRDLQEKEIRRLYKELGLKKEKINERLESKEKNDNKGHDALVLKEKQFDERCKQMEVREKEINERFQELKKKEEQINALRRVLLLRENRVNDFNEGIKLKGKELYEDGEIMELEDKQVDNQHSQSEELKEKETDGNRSPSHCQEEEQLSKLQVASINSTRVSVEPPTSVESSLSSSIGGEIYLLCQTMDADGVRSYLTKHVDEQNLLQEKILDALRSAPDPAKLVLDVHKYPSKDQIVALKNSCIFLLEQLRKLSPPITSYVKVEALSLAQNWNVWLKWWNKDVDNFGFLQFIASFKLTNSFNADELISVFINLYCGQNIYRQQEHNLLCNTLGLSEKIPGLIKSLIEKKKWLLAVKFICVFNLECDFSPMPLLEAFVHHIKERANDRRKDGTSISKFEVVCMELQNIQELYKCITNFKLELKVCLDSLQSCIKNLEKEKETMQSVIKNLEKEKEDVRSQVMKKRGSSSCEEAQLEKCQRVAEDVPPAAPLDRTLMPHCATPHITPDVLVKTPWQQGTMPENPQLGPHNTHGYATHVSLNAQLHWHVFNGPHVASLHRPPCLGSIPPRAAIQNIFGQAALMVPNVQYTGQPGTMPQANGHYQGLTHLGSGFSHSFSMVKDN